MSTAKSLSEDQIATIQQWADAGTELSDIQKLLGSELGVRLTYLETRFLLDDLGIEIAKEPEPEPELEPETEPEPEVKETSEPAGEEGPGDPEADFPAGPDLGGDATATVTIDTVQRPGAIVSGRVTFDGGEAAAWWLDQMGRLGMDADNTGFKPSESQLMEFQRELQRAIQEKGL